MCALRARAMDGRRTFISEVYAAASAERAAALRASGTAPPLTAAAGVPRPAARQRILLQSHSRGAGTGKSMQLLVAWARRRSFTSSNCAWARAVWRPLLTTVPMARTGPVSTVIGRRNFTVRSSEVYATPCGRVDWSAARSRVEQGGEDAAVHAADGVVVLLPRRQREDRPAGLHLVQGEVDGAADGRPGQPSRLHLAQEVDAGHAPGGLRRDRGIVPVVRTRSPHGPASFPLTVS
ncbi:hypothetical protein QFZ55_000810 [Streptomyces luteogriseus]|nr:hypothetical protein [Streptomyces luteogriseus]